MLSPFFRLFILFLAISFHANAATSLNDDYLGALWVAESNGVLKLATSDGSVLFEIGNAVDVQAIALDEQRGLLWAYGDAALSAYAFNGTLIAQQYNSEAKGNASTAVLAVSPSDGSVWLGRGSEVLHFSSIGQPMGSVNIGKMSPGLLLPRKHPPFGYLTIAQSLSLRNRTVPCN